MGSMAKKREKAAGSGREFSKRPGEGPQTARPFWFPLAAGGLILGLLAGVLALLEGIAWLAGWGYDTRPLIPAPGYEEVWIDNPHYLRKFYPGRRDVNDGESVRPNLVERVKPAGVLRGVVLGGSTAQGFPFVSNQSFAKIAEAAWNRLAPEGAPRVELINLGRSAQSSWYVRDTASKLAAYDPDFLVIYAGHNEYYGTLGTATGAPWARQLYLALKESRLVQSLLETFEPSGPAGEGAGAGGAAGPTGPAGARTRMAQQLAQGRFAAEPARDEAVARDFTANIQAALGPWLEQGRPVFVFEPVSNLEMPPFAGDAAADWHRRGRERLAAGADPRGEWGQAKDADELPFRARSALVSALGAWARQAGPGLHFIPTEARLTETYGRPDAWGKTLFLDHLHFNEEGQRALAALLTEAWAETWAPDWGGAGSAQGAEARKAWFGPEGGWDEAVFLTEFFRLRAWTNIRTLTSAAPYTDMKPAPDFGVDAGFQALALWQDEALRAALEASRPEGHFDRVQLWYRQTRQLAPYWANLEGLAFVNPSGAEARRLLADFLASNPNLKERAGEEYLKAWLLGRRDSDTVRRYWAAWEGSPGAARGVSLAERYGLPRP